MIKALKYKITLILLLVLGMGQIQAQEKPKQEGEIVMTQAELDSLLSKLVRIKKERIEKKKQQREELSTTKFARSSSDVERTTYSYSTKVVDPARENLHLDAIYREFDRLHNRIDNLMLNLMRSGESSQANDMRKEASPASFEPVEVDVNFNYTPVVIDDAKAASRSDAKVPTSSFAGDVLTTESSAEPAAFVEESPQAVVDAKQIEEIQALKSQISEMNEQIRVLGNLEEQIKTDAYTKEIADLNALVKKLQAELSENEKKEAEARKEAERLAALKQESIIVYFDNNSVNLSKADEEALSKVADIIIQNRTLLKVELHGFASTSGSAAYNKQISQRRAETVKETLLKQGLLNSDINILPHGEDSGKDAKEARRVEVRIK